MSSSTNSSNRAALFSNREGYNGMPKKQHQQPNSPDPKKHPSSPDAKVGAARKSKGASSALELISEDLTSTLAAWTAQSERLYGETPPVGELAVTVVAATGISKTVDEPFWLACVGGVADETGTSTPLATATQQAPAGAPSWQADPLTLKVHDTTSDLLLLLCEAGGTTACRACVGRAIVPLSELLPLMPCGMQPAALETWIDIFPPAAEYAVGTVQPILAAALDDVDGSGMARPAQKGRVLVRVCLTLSSSYVGNYLHVAPFDAAAGASAEGRASRVAVAPERVLVTARRVRALLEGHGLPACMRLAARRPWSSGLALLALAGWLCLFFSAPMLPWWLIALWVLNGARATAARYPRLGRRALASTLASATLHVRRLLTHRASRPRAAAAAVDAGASGR